ncbi:MAG: hypothetical protein EXX96DRAFT_550220 [Benjaminiella poitrasii]|nr:MAG: hypothetical protein EXX96DRAFT_550220 [Benjaminiella poitrasii]
MQSKLFVLRLLSACMQHHWRYCRDLEKDKNNNTPVTELDVTLPPLDSTLVTYLLVLMSRYVTQYHLIEESSINLEQNTNTTPFMDYSECESGYSYEQIKLSLITDIYKAASKILCYISASNWDACYTKIKNAISSLGSVIGAADKIPPEIRMLESSCLTREKLSTVFSELTPYYLHMRLEGKLIFSKMMRKAIWKWIETYPKQFAEVCASDERLLPGTEVLFDMCSSTADNSRKKATLWPLQTILLVLSPEFLTQAFLNTAPVHNRRGNFLTLLKQSLQTVRDSDIAAVCYVDLCKAATYVPPNNESILRSIAADVEADLKEKVWNFDKPLNSESTLALSGYTVDQQTLITDFLFSWIRLYPEDTLTNIIPPCIDENVPISFKLAFIKTCLDIVDEENHLPWNPTISSMYNGLGAPLRKLFLQTIHMDLNSSLSNKKKETHSKHNNKVELLLEMLRIFRIDTRLAIFGNNVNRVEENSKFMVGLATLYQHPVQRVRQGALELLVKIHQSDIIIEWGPIETALSNFWSISSPAVLRLAEQILECKSNDENLKTLLQFIVKLFKERISFLKIRQRFVVPESDSIQERLRASVTLEIALLVSLCSANKDICDEVLKCFSILCKECKILDDDEDGREMNSRPLSSNLKIYEELSKDGSKYVGRKAQQKRIRKYLRMLPHHTPANMVAWGEAWQRWMQLTPVIKKLSSEDTIDHGSIDTRVSSVSSPVNLSSTLANATSSTNNSLLLSNSNNTSTNKKQLLSRNNEKPRTSSINSTISGITKFKRNSEKNEDRVTEWQNLTGFLAALGGCCLMNNQSEWLTEKAYKASFISNEPMLMAGQFISEMTELLVSDNMYISEGVKDTLGNDLSPVLYVILFQRLEEYIKKCFDSNGGAIRSIKNKLFVEQSTLVMRLILDRLVGSSDSLLNIDFSNLMHQFAEYLNGLPNTYNTLRIKVKMCLLIQAVMQKKEQIVIRNETRLRNKLLEICVEWMSDFSLPHKSVDTSQQVEMIQKDLDQACLKSIVSLLHQLPLQPQETMRTMDIFQVKNKLFLKYFDFFRKLLDKYKQTEKDIATINRLAVSNSANNIPINTTYSNARDSSLKSLISSGISLNDSYQDIGQMKELTILAMSHLLSANVDTGLKYSLNMGYDDDFVTRTAFMQVLTNILDQGTEFENLAENIMTDRYEKLIDILVEADMEIVMSLCEVCPSPDVTGVAETLLICFESRNKAVPLLKAVIEKELSLTKQESTLFRGTTIATRILSLYAKLSCLDYIRITLQPAMEEINALSEEELTWELDMQKVVSTEQVMINKRNVIKATEILLKTICSSIDSVPRAFREELSLISDAVNVRFPEARTIVVGGFVFLRLFGPAILTPENAGFAKHALPKSTNVRKILLQATRVMQNLANNVLFGSKETHMIILNDFLTNNIYRVTNFLRAISTLPPDIQDDFTGNVCVDQAGYVKLHKYLSDNLERMSRDLTGRKRSSSHSDTQALLRWKKTLDRLSNILAQLGRPSNVPSSELSYSRNYAFANSNHYYNEFMRRNEHRDLTDISSQNIFYLGGTSRGGRPVFYMICRAVDSEEMDFELLIYYMLRVMEPYLNNLFELLFDTTEFSSTRAIPIHWMSQFFQLVFSEMNDYLVSLHLYNPNTYLQKYIQKLPRTIVNKFVKRTHFSSSLIELHKHIAPTMVRLPKETIELEKETSVTIFPVLKITHLRSSIPVIVKIGTAHMQVITTKKQEILYNLNTILRDVYHISNIEDITVLPSAKPEIGGEISIKYDKGKSTMVLSSAKRDIILAQLLHNKQRYETLKLTPVNKRTIRPNDVPGRLLNMTLLNLGSEDPGLRLSAYNLLYSLSLSFRFDIDNQLLNAKDLCIPSNNSDFIVNISKSLARSKAHLTLEFLSEALTGFENSDNSMRQLCLDYMAPWLLNLSLFAQNSLDNHKQGSIKAKEVLVHLIDLTVSRLELYKHIQAKIWKTIAEAEDIIDLVVDSFVRYSVKSGIGSSQAEIIADTLVTMSSTSSRGKVISRMRRVLEGTSIQPCGKLVDHPSWSKIAILLRFILMLSFNNIEPIASYIPEIFHIVSMLVASGPTLIRSSVHELVVNTIHYLCTTDTSLPDENIKKLHFLLNDLCDSKNRVSFGLTKQHANAFTITKETTTDFAETIDLISLQNVIRLLIDALSFGAPTVNIANAWRARWMGLVTSTAFYFNPAIQPRSFIALGCLAQEEIDDDLIYQILVALKGALAIFNENDSSLIISITMCLNNIIDNLPSNSRYLLYLFWLAVALVQIGHPAIFQTSVRFLHSVLRALYSRKFFVHQSVEDVLLKIRIELNEIANELDNACGVNFKDYFSFAVAIILLKGLKQCDNKDIVFQCLTAFLEISCKRPMEQSLIEARALGYLAGLLPFAAKDDIIKELLRLAGINDVELDCIDLNSSHTGLFYILEIPDNSTALLFVSLLVALLNASENESERLFLYRLLSDTAISVPDVFALVYESLLPKMNQILVSSQNHDTIEAVKNILLTVCSEPAFNMEGQSTTNSSKRTQKWELEKLNFASLCDPTFGAVKTNVTINAKLASELLGYITDQR